MTDPFEIPVGDEQAPPARTRMELIELLIERLSGDACEEDPNGQCGECPPCLAAAFVALDREG